VPMAVATIHCRVCEERAGAGSTSSTVQQSLVRLDLNMIRPPLQDESPSTRLHSTAGDPLRPANDS
jgi:hypothetical protein